jgi:hypothetical protein
MTEFIVCPADEDLLKTMGGKSVVIRMHNADEMISIRDLAMEHSFHIHCTILTLPTLTTICLDDIHPDLPVALHVNRMGPLPALLRMLPELRRYNIRVYIPLTQTESFTDLRILSSLGVHCAGVFDSKKQNWELAIDLMTYALLGRAPHAPIFPFHYLAKRYNPQNRLNWNTVFFDDPNTYLHMNTEGKLALSSSDLEHARYLHIDVDHLEDLPTCPEFIVREEKWEQHFLDYDSCSCCPGWRVCYGLFADERDGGGCESFFTEFIDCAEQYQRQAHTESGRENIWQP